MSDANVGPNGNPRGRHGEEPSMDGTQNIADLLPAYASGELSQAEAERVEAALADSQRLREELARYEQLFVLLSAAAAEEVGVPRDLRARISGQIILRSYLEAAASLVEGLAGRYGRAIIYYLGLG